MTHITIPGVDRDALAFVFDQNALLGAFSLLTGGSAENFSIVLMGLSPYINASIIMQLLTVIVPRLEDLSKEGQEGRKTINRWTRWITFPLAFAQSFGMILLINAQAQVPIIADVSFMALWPIMLTVSAGTVILMWLGELITEKGLGNGISILIFASILAAVPNLVGPSLALAQEEPERLIPMVGILLITLILTLIVVLFTEGQRRIPVTYGRRGAKGQQSFLPIRVNQAGMIPIIFAVSIVSFPSIAGQFFTYAKSQFVQDLGSFLVTSFDTSSISYILIYFFLVIGFTYFYVSITFNAEEVAESIQKRGGFVPGLRPGKETTAHLAMVSNRMNLFGGTMIAAIAVLPLVVQMIFTNLNVGSVPLVVGGAGVIIVVGVVLDLIRRINADLLVHHYDRFYKG
jgi:preprotein translocase subunit SecY